MRGVVVLDTKGICYDKTRVILHRASNLTDVLTNRRSGVRGVFLPYERPHIVRTFPGEIWYKLIKVTTT